MELMRATFDVYIDNSESARTQFLAENPSLAGRVLPPEALRELDPATLTVFVFSAQAWDMELQLEEYSVPPSMVWNFVEVDEWKPAIIKIPRDLGFHALSSLISESDVCVDVGANEGLYAIKMASLISTSTGGQVFAVEPFSYSRQALFRNLRASSSEVTVLPVAFGPGSGPKSAQIAVPKVGHQVKAGSASIRAGDSSETGPGGTIPFKITEDDADFGSVSWSDPKQWEFLHETVQLSSFDEAFDSTSRVNFVKIDVEGFELEVLRGAERVLSENSPKLLIESTSGSRSYDEIKGFLAPFGYRAVNLETYLPSRLSRDVTLTNVHQNHLWLAD
jgi:FkbM family methyltransferase